VTDHRPTARDDLEVYEAEDGLLVYDLQRDRAHHLNPTAAIVFSLCTGDVDPQTMAGHLATTFGLDEPPLAEVDECLATLREEGLVV
jgi:hypothetical protein